MSKYFFRGNRENGLYLLSKLIKLGGKPFNDDINGTNPRCVYYISESNENIYSRDIESGRDLLMSGYEDIYTIDDESNWEKRELDLAKEILFSLTKNGFKETLNLDTGEKSINKESIDEFIDLSIETSNKFIRKFKNRNV